MTRGQLMTGANLCREAVARLVHDSQFVVSSAHARVACLCYERHINKYHAVE